MYSEIYGKVMFVKFFAKYALAPPVLIHILSTLGIMGTASEVTVSNAEYLEVTEDEDGEDWTVNVLQSIVSATMRVTIDSNQEYEISVSIYMIIVKKRLR